MFKMVVELVMMRIILSNSDYVNDLESLKKQLRRGFISPYEMYGQVLEKLTEWAIDADIVWTPEVQNLLDPRSNPGKGVYTLDYICHCYKDVLNEMAFNIAMETADKR